MESNIDGPNSSHKRRQKRVTIATASKDGASARSWAGARKSPLEDKLATLSVLDQGANEGTGDGDASSGGSMSDLPRSDSLDEQQISRIHRLQKIFGSVHQSFKTRETALAYFTKNKPHPEYDIIKWELISLAYCVELCVKYEEHVLTQGRKLLETAPDILTRLSAESETDQMHVIVLPARNVCTESGQLQWLAVDADPRILVVPKAAIENETNLRILSEHGEVFAELWKMYRDGGAEDRLESIHGMLESLTLPPVEALPPVKQRCAILKRLMTLSSNANFAGFERRLAKDLFCSDRFGDGADSWIFSFMIWKCVHEVHGDRLSREEHVSRGQK
ncbi:hypothetical protein HDU77_005276 [Chytriomyces hyalinus]|nr:hypothetical protein HDU77_005276 [Chytriomyces hyalinus]